MDTKLAKNYTIIFLTILNILLFFISFLLQDKYKISKEQEKTIISYLQQENVKIYLKLPKKYQPMAKFNMRKIKNDDFALQKIFFENNVNLTRTERFEDIIFKQGDKTLIINNFFVYFEDLEKKDGFMYNKKNAINIAQKYKKYLEDIYSKMYLEKVEENEGYFLISYTQKINKYRVFNNILNVKVYKEGEVDIYFNGHKNIEKISSKINIYSSDEALYTFVKEIKKLIPDKEIFIMDIDLGYYLKNDSENVSFNFLPYYRFYVKGIETPFYVNAYTNTFEYENAGISTKEIFI